MPIPLGIFAVAGAGGGSSGSYELISTTTGAGSPATITFSSIPSTYKHLQLRLATAVTSGAGGVITNLRMNGVTSASYSVHYLEANGSSVSAVSSTSTQQISVGWTAGYISGAHGGMIIDILDYASTSKNKTIRSLAGSHTPGVPRVGLYAGAFYSTSAVDSITIFLGDNFATTSRFSLYGIKG